MHAIRKWSRDPASIAYFVLLCVALPMLAVSLVSFLVHPQRAVDSIFYLSFQDRYMDFFNCIRDARTLDVYLSHDSSLYPPLANLMYYGLGKLLPAESLAQYAGQLSRDPAGLTLYWITQGTCCLLFLFMLASSIKGPLSRRVTVFMLGALCMPVLFAFERGNCVLLTMFFIMVFFRFYRDPSPLRREIGFICLAIAANLKLYPALFGLLLVAERRWKEAARTLLYGVLLFVVPLFLHYNGLLTLKLMLNNLRYNSYIQVEAGLGYKISWINFFHIISRLTGLPLIRWLPYLLLLTGIVSVFLLPEFWQRVAMISLICAGFSNFSMVYNTIYLFLPFLAITHSEKISHFLVWFLFFLFLSVFPLAIGGQNPFPELSGNSSVLLNITTLLDCVCVMGMTVALFVLAFASLKRNRLPSSGSR